MANFLNTAEVVGAMQANAWITALILAENIFDNIPAEAPGTDFLIVEGAISQRNKLCHKTNRVSIRYMSWSKDGGTFPVLRNIYNTVNSFLVWDNKVFWSIEIYLVEETTYLETVDELGKNTIINDYFFNFIK